MANEIRYGYDSLCADPKISVFILTYNQENEIKVCLDSVLQQKTNFSYEIVLSNDASSDRTHEVCLQYAKDFPDKIVYFEQRKNLGLIKNFIQTSKHLRAPLIAICDGDDYWTDKNKLQKQYDYLSDHLGVSVIGGQTQRQPIYTGVYSLQEMMIENRISAPTCLLRKPSIMDHYPEWFKELPYGDWVFHLWSMMQYKGNAVVTNDAVAYYRIGGLTTDMKKDVETIYDTNILILKNLKKEVIAIGHEASIDKAISSLTLRKMTICNRKRNYRKALVLFFQLIPDMSFYRLISLYLISIKKGL